MDIYTTRAVPAGLGRFVRRLVTADLPLAFDLTAPAPPTGYNYLGWVIRGRGIAIAGGEDFPVATGQVHVSGQIVRIEAYLRTIGPVRHVLAELEPTGLYELLGLEAAWFRNRVWAFDPTAATEKLLPLQALVQANPGAPIDEDEGQFLSALEALAETALDAPDSVRRLARFIHETDGASPLNKADLGVSAKHAAMMFRRVVGCSPKYFAQTVRINRVLAALSQGDSGTLADIAARFGFFDQSHLVRSVRQFHKRTPSSFTEPVEGLLRSFPLDSQSGLGRFSDSV